MKRSTKILWILFIVGFVGTAIMTGFIMGSGQLMSREASQDIGIDKAFDELRLDTVAAQVNVVPSEFSHVTTYAKAWLSKPINMDEVVNMQVANGVLQITETPFPPKFFGVFPQPYELTITLYMPREICEAYQEDMEK